MLGFFRGLAVYEMSPYRASAEDIGGLGGLARDAVGSSAAEQRGALLAQFRCFASRSFGQAKRDAPPINFDFAARFRGFVYFFIAAVTESLFHWSPFKIRIFAEGSFGGLARGCRAGVEMLDEVKGGRVHEFYLGFNEEGQGACGRVGVSDLGKKMFGLLLRGVEFSEFLDRVVFHGSGLHVEGFSGDGVGGLADKSWSHQATTIRNCIQNHFQQAGFTKFRR